ncbi:MAG: flagellar basal body P-ring formation chaperone FlgA [Rickettsiales endosymbiont of Dermacentor nuttalli]
MIKTPWLGNLLVRYLNKFIILCFIYISSGSHAIAISNVDEQLKHDIQTFLINEGALLNTLNNEVQISYDISKKTCINWQEVSSFVTKITNINKKNRRFIGYIKAMSTVDSGNIEIPISGQYEEYIIAPVLKSPMRFGEIIRIQNIDKIRVNVSKLKSNAILDSAFLLNKTPKNSVAAYQVLNENQLVVPKIVNKNDIVTALYKRGNLILKLEVLALDAGASGELIRVKNQRSGIIFDAIVEDRDKVCVR